MKWFYNLKIATKLLSSFTIVALIAAFVGYMGITDMQKIDKSDTELYENMTVPIAEMSSIINYFQRVRVNTRDVILAKTQEKRNEYLSRIQTYSDSIGVIAKRFEAKILSPEMRSLYDTFISTRVEYKKDLGHLQGIS